MSADEECSRLICVSLEEKEGERERRRTELGRETLTERDKREEEEARESTDLQTREVKFKFFAPEAREMTHDAVHGPEIS